MLPCVAACMMTATPVKAAETDEDGVKQAVAEFYAALNKMFTGEVAPMKAVWSHADDVTYMGPNGGFQKGWPAVEKIWDENAALKMGGKVAPAEMEIRVGEDLAIVSNYEEGENNDAEGNVVKVRIRATSLFRKEDGKWKMIGHHTDLLPFLSKKS